MFSTNADSYRQLNEEFKDTKVTVPASWYDSGKLERLVYSCSSSKKLSSLKFVFLPQDNGQDFTKQLVKLNDLNKKLNTHSCFIATEPAPFNTSHFIMGVLFEDNLLIINPMGITRHEHFYTELITVLKKLKLTNIYISTTVIQRDPKAIVSCGPISVELINYISTLPLPTIKTILKAKEKTSHHRTTQLIYQAVDLVNTKLLPSRLASMGQLSNDYYEKILSSIRHDHDQKYLAEVNHDYDEYCINQNLLDEDHKFEADPRFLQLQNRLIPKPVLSPTPYLLLGHPSSAFSSVSRQVRDSSSSSSSSDVALLGSRSPSLFKKSVSEPLIPINIEDHSLEAVHDDSKCCCVVM